MVPRRFLLAVLAVAAANAQPTLYVSAAVAKNYVVGAKLPSSGLFSRNAAGEWRHIGFTHPLIYGLDYDPRDPSVLYLAAGNGLIRASQHGERWKILTGSDITEIRDLALDANAPGTIYLAHCHGVRVTHDSGATWEEISGGLPRKFTEALRVDRRMAGVVIVGTERGLYRTPDGGRSWKLVGAEGVQIMRLEQSPHDPCHWLAATQNAGLFASHDCGETFENEGSLGVGRGLYDIAFDPTAPRRIAVAGWGPGVAVSTDGGKTWILRNAGLPRPDVWSVVFDPAHAGRLYANVHQDAVYVSEDAGATWTKAGLLDAVVTRMKFVPEARP